MIFNYGAHKQRIISYAFLIVTKKFRFLLQFTGEEQRVKCSFSDHLHRGDMEQKWSKRFMRNTMNNAAKVPNIVVEFKLERGSRDLGGDLLQADFGSIDQHA